MEKSRAQEFQSQRDFAISVAERLTAAGFQALWAGGCVRDLLMGHEPDDYDVATSATPNEVRELFGRRRTLAIGASFGVIVVLPPKKSLEQVEVATFRTDSTYSDGRRPDDITFSSPIEDAQRRDFTINGMFYDPQKSEFIDYVGGKEDLANRLVRAIGDPHRRIAEDKLRMLRAIRFAARFDFQMDAATRHAVAAHAADVSVVSGERIATEIRKILQTNAAYWAIDECSELGLLQHVMPSVAQHWNSIRGAAKPLLGAQMNWQTRMAGLVSLLPGEEPSRLIDGLKKRLKLSNEDCSAMEFAIKSQPALERCLESQWSEIQPWLINPYIDCAVALLKARLLPERQDERTRWLENKLALPKEQLAPDPFLDGQDLIQMGAKPGPKFKRILRQALNMQLDGQLQDRTQSLDWAKGELQQPE